MCRIKLGIIILDLWLLLRMRKLLFFFMKWMHPVLKIACIMGFGAGLLFIYAFINVKDEMLPFSEKFDFKKLGKCKHSVFPDAPKSCQLPMEKELVRLKTKAFSLENMLRKMRLQLSRFYNCRSKETSEMADFASEAVGGCVLDTPNTETYFEVPYDALSIFGIPIWRPRYHTPRKVIQPWTQAGECWAFKGSCGRIIIDLAKITLISHVTLEHIPVSVSITGSIDAAPKTFSVYGQIKDEFVNIDYFTYNINGPATQTFAIKNREMKEVPFKRIQLEIHSNWGNPVYTCIYRFKVHGKLFDDSQM